MTTYTNTDDNNKNTNNGINEIYKLDISTVGVVGSGVMGAGIAATLLMGRYIGV